MFTKKCVFGGADWNNTATFFSYIFLGTSEVLGTMLLVLREVCKKLLQGMFFPRKDFIHS